MKNNDFMKMNKYLVVMSLLFSIGTIFGSIDSTNVELISLRNSGGVTRYGSIDPVEYKAAIDQRTRGCLHIITVGCVALIVSGLLVYPVEKSLQSASSLDPYVLTNDSPYEIFVGCPDSFFLVTTLKPGATETIKCFAKSGQLSSLTASTFGDSLQVKNGNPTTRTDAHTSHYIITALECTRNCAHFHRVCSGSGKSRSCYLWLHTMQKALSFTPANLMVENRTESVNLQQHTNLRGYWNGLAPEYFSDIVPATELYEGLPSLVEEK